MSAPGSANEPMRVTVVPGVIVAPPPALTVGATFSTWIVVV